jgi:tripartite-type tricarboxylate transporter receptor subunit TctC
LLFKLATHTDVLHVPSKGASPAVADPIGGQIPVMLANLPAMLPRVQAVRAGALGVRSSTKHAFRCSDFIA